MREMVVTAGESLIAMMTGFYVVGKMRDLTVSIYSVFTVRLVVEAAGRDILHAVDSDLQRNLLRASFKAT